MRSGTLRLYRTDGYIPSSNPRFAYVQRVSPEAEELVADSLRLFKDLGRNGTG